MSVNDAHLQTFSFALLFFKQKFNIIPAHPTNPVEGCADANPKTMLSNDT